MSMKGGGTLLRSNKLFRLLFVSRVISLTGSAVAPIAQAFAVLELTRSASAFGVVLAAGYVPLIVFLLLGGVVADRIDRGIVMVWSNIACAAAQAVLAVLLIVGVARIWQVAALACVCGAASAFFGPASSGIVPQIVDPREVHDANALLRLSMNCVRVLGPALGGMAVAVCGAGWVIAWDAITFASAAALFARLRIPLPPRPAATMIADLAEGWAQFWSLPWLWSLVLQYSLINAVWVGGFELLGPIMSQERLGGASSWGLITAALAAGLLAGGALILAWKPKRPLLAATLSTLTKAAPLAAMATGQSLMMIIAATFIAGVGTEVFIVCFYSALQREVPADRMSRVSSYDIFLGTILVPVGYLLAGPLAATIGIGATLQAGIAVIAISTCAVLLLPLIRSYRDSDIVPEHGLGESDNADVLD